MSKGKNQEKRWDTSVILDDVDIFERNGMRVTEILVKVMRYLALVLIPIYIGNFLNFFRIDYTSLNILTVYTVIMLWTPTLLQKLKFPSSILRYVCIIGLACVVGALATNANIGIYMTYALALLASIFYYDKRFTFHISILTYFVIVISLYFRSRGMVQVEFETNTIWWFSRSMGFLIEAVAMGGVSCSLASVSRGMLEKMDVSRREAERAEEIERYSRELAVAKEEAERAKVQAEAASQAKSSFLANMSHEIRTPINAVLGMDEIILREYREPALVGYALDIQASARTLLSLVNDILDFSKIEAGKMELVEVDYEVSSMVNDLVNMISARAKEKNLELKLEIDETTPYILHGDDVRLRQVILNLLTNAVKYTENGSITFSLSHREIGGYDTELLVFVKDTGIGIREEELKKLFFAFERVDEARNRTIEGTGLGLNIVGSLLALMGSKLEVKSTYGIGSEFSFKVKQRVVKWEPLGNYAASYKHSMEEARQYHESFRAPYAKVLVVDDTRTNLTVIKGLLKPLQIHVETATSGKECIQKVIENHYDIIFLDHRMPEMDGVETFRAMREHWDNLNLKTPVIALTANAVSGAREMYLKEGFRDYLSKPVESAKLELMLQKYLPDELIIPPEEFEGRTNVIRDPMSVIEASGEEQSSGGMDVAEDGEMASADQGQSGSPLDRMEGIDLQEALKNCGDEEILLEVIGEFRDTLEGRADAIEKHFMAMDFRNYTVEVHGLKSSARLIGAMELSNLAARMEEAGNAEDRETILDQTPGLLELYRSYMEKLGGGKEDGVEDNREDIDPEYLREGLIAIRELVDGFDFDSADGAFQTLMEYRIPEEYDELVRNLKVDLAEVDREKILELLKDYQ